ncbi:hypothetical protein E2C01_044749 [Portunus trituberculatus]|uniref:Uncharacterized protein n=1 Tax=Portunus trituberculatus TaxID=210409 RepID=A0A5B7FZ75_PORTR|nr:hypothetical protein [Portunus trituberculatus]
MNIRSQLMAYPTQSKWRGGGAVVFGKERMWRAVPPTFNTSAAGGVSAVLPHNNHTVLTFLLEYFIFITPICFYNIETSNFEQEKM